MPKGLLLEIICTDGYVAGYLHEINDYNVVVVSGTLGGAMYSHVRKDRIEHIYLHNEKNEKSLNELESLLD